MRSASHAATGGVTALPKAWYLKESRSSVERLPLAGTVQSCGKAMIPSHSAGVGLRTFPALG